MMSAITASNKRDEFDPTCTLLNSCSWNLRPPQRKDRPITSSKLPRMLPIRLACTTLIIVASVSVPEPACIAAIIASSAIIISAALPNVAFRRPPIDSDVLKAISSVALPIKNASGIIAIIEAMKERVASCAINAAYMATGAANRRILSRLDDMVNEWYHGTSSELPVSCSM